MLPSCFPESSIPRGSKQPLSFLPSDRDRHCKTSKPMADSLFQKVDSIVWWISQLPPVFYRFMAINRFVLPEPLKRKDKPIKSIRQQGHIFQVTWNAAVNTSLLACQQWPGYVEALMYPDLSVLPDSSWICSQNTWPQMEPFGGSAHTYPASQLPWEAVWWECPLSVGSETRLVCRSPSWTLPQACWRNLTRPPTFSVPGCSPL